jgi:hypothetical protein
MQFAAVTAVAVLMTIAGANAAMASVTNPAGQSGLHGSSGLAAILWFQPAADTLTGTPYRVSIGIFTLVFSPCSTAEPDAAVFNAAPESGSEGQTSNGPTVVPAGFVSRAVTGPGALSLIGAALIGLGMLRRGRIFRK